VELHVIKSQKFTLMGKTFGPYENETIGLPEYAAVYLMCKKAAVLSNNAGKGENVISTSVPAATEDRIA